AGMNVARLNFSHGTHESHLLHINHLKKAREVAQSPLAIMLDTKGPEIRVGKLPNDALSLKPNTRFKLVSERRFDDEIPIHPFEALSQVSPGLNILFDDGYIISTIVGIESDAVVVEIQNEGILKSGKGINVPGATIALPAMTPKDIADLKFGCE